MIRNANCYIRLANSLSVPKRVSMRVSDDVSLTWHAPGRSLPSPPYVYVLKRRRSPCTLHALGDGARRAPGPATLTTGGRRPLTHTRVLRGAYSAFTPSPASPPAGRRSPVIFFDCGIAVKRMGVCDPRARL